MVKEKLDVRRCTHSIIRLRLLLFYFKKMFTINYIVISDALYNDEKFSRYITCIKEEAVEKTMQQVLLINESETRLFFKKYFSSSN